MNHYHYRISSGLDFVASGKIIRISDGRKLKATHKEKADRRTNPTDGYSGETGTAILATRKKDTPQALQKAR